MSDIDELRAEVAALRKEVAELESSQRTFVKWLYQLAAGDVQVMEWLMLSVQPPTAHPKEAAERRELLYSEIWGRLEAAEANAKLAEQHDDT